MSTVTEQKRSLRFQVLDYAAYLIEEFGWCQNAPARDELGLLVLPQSPDAVSFCLTGAVERAIYDLLDGWDVRHQGIPPGIKIAKRDEKSPIRGPLEPSWNNDPQRTRDEVIALLRERASIGS